MIGLSEFTKMTECLRLQIQQGRDMAFEGYR